MNAERTEEERARRYALRVAPLWDAPGEVLKWLTTGDENLRPAARRAAWRAPSIAGRSSCGAAECAATRAAALAATTGAARESIRAAILATGWAAAHSAVIAGAPWKDDRDREDTWAAARDAARMEAKDWEVEMA